MPTRLRIIGDELRLEGREGDSPASLRLARVPDFPIRHRSRARSNPCATGTPTSSRLAGGARDRRGGQPPLCRPTWMSPRRAEYNPTIAIRT
jgi:hypothetical protein